MIVSLAALYYSCSEPQVVQYININGIKKWYLTHYLFAWLVQIKIKGKQYNNMVDVIKVQKVE